MIFIVKRKEGEKIIEYTQPEQEDKCDSYNSSKLTYSAPKTGIYEVCIHPEKINE